MTGEIKTYSDAAHLVEESQFPIASKVHMKATLSTDDKLTIVSSRFVKIFVGSPDSIEGDYLVRDGSTPEITDIGTTSRVVIEEATEDSRFGSAPAAAKFNFVETTERTLGPKVGAEEEEARASSDDVK